MIDNKYALAMAFYLQALRDKKGYSKQEIAIRSDLSEEEYNLLEMGMIEPDLSQLEKIADFYELKYDIFLKAIYEIINEWENPIK
jgi:transcriptional regulator with XRE-family HTH domain